MKITLFCKRDAIQTGRAYPRVTNILYPRGGHGHGDADLNATKNQ
jgi:hypothetical protein